LRPPGDRTPRTGPKEGQSRRWLHTLHLAAQGLLALGQRLQLEQSSSDLALSLHIDLCTFQFKLARFGIHRKTPLDLGLPQALGEFRLSPLSFFGTLESRPCPGICIRAGCFGFPRMPPSFETALFSLTASANGVLRTLLCLLYAAGGLNTLVFGFVKMAAILCNTALHLCILVAQKSHLTMKSLPLCQCLPECLIQLLP